MKKSIYSIIVLAGSLLLFACNNGDYLSNPATYANASGNPIRPYSDSDEFSWAKSSYAFSAKLNGVSYVADSDHVTWSLDTLGYNVVRADNGTGRIVTLYFRDVYARNLYTFGTLVKENMLRYGIITDTGTPPKIYTSVFGNIGQVWIRRNDTLYGFLPHFEGKFYFQALDKPTGTVMNAAEGYFNARKY